MASESVAEAVGLISGTRNLRNHPLAGMTTGIMRKIPCKFHQDLTVPARNVPLLAIVDYHVFSMTSIPE